MKLFIFIICAVCQLTPAFGQPPRTLSYQAVLTDNAGVPKPDGAYAVTFRLYTAVSGGAALWTESQTLQVRRGLFSAVLGSVTPLGTDLAFAQPYWLSLQVAPDAEMSPRLRLTSTAYSLAPWTSIGSDLYFSGGNVGIGTTNPQAKLAVVGDAWVTPGGSGGTINFGTPNAETGMTISGNSSNSRADLRFDGSSLKLLAGTGAGPPPLGNGIAITTSGNVGIGTDAPVAKLDVENASGFGVVVGTTSGTGVLAYTTNGTGVYGSSGNGYGVYSGGNFGASGTKSFRIDHPKDPTGKYLLHYSAESPDVLNMYTGNVVTDANGYATITLPDYFGEINKDPRYTLTVINEDGTDFVQAMVVQKIRNNRFVVRTSKPDIEVSWEVKALRNDLWVRTYGAPVQVEKQGLERGKYQRPELYGMPKEMGMNYRPEMERATAEPVVTTPSDKKKQ